MGKRTRMILIIFGMFITIFAGSLTTREPDMKQGYAILLAGFVSTTGYLFLVYRRYKTVDYDEPVREFLDKAEKRYQFMSPTDTVILPVLITIFYLGGSMVFRKTLSKYTDQNTIVYIAFLVVFIFVIFMGFYFSRQNWEKENGELLRKIQEMKRRLK